MVLGLVWPRLDGSLLPCLMPGYPLLVLLYSFPPPFSPPLSQTVLLEVIGAWNIVRFMRSVVVNSFFDLTISTAANSTTLPYSIGALFGILLEERAET